MKLTETQLDKLKDKFIDYFIKNMDVDQLKQYVRDDMNTYLARRNEEEVVNEMYGHLVDEDVVNKIITEVPVDNDLTSDEYRELLFLVTYADLGRRTRDSTFIKIKRKLQNQLAILEGREEPNK